MSFLNKQAAGFYCAALSALLAIVGLIFYLVNCKTDYFMNVGVSPVVVGCAVVAIAAEALLLLACQKAGESRALDLLAVAPAVLLMVAFVTLVGSRVASIATIMTFENNAQTMADLSSALVGIVCLLLAMLTGIIASFCKVAKN